MEAAENNPATLQEKIGRNIEKIRTAKEIPAKNMATELGLTLAGYRNIERGKTDMTIVKIVKIATILEVEYTELLSVETKNVYHNHNNANVNNYSNHIHNQMENGYKIALAEQKEQITHLRQQIEDLFALLKKGKP